LVIEKEEQREVQSRAGTTELQEVVLYVGKKYHCNNKNAMISFLNISVKNTFS